MAVNRAIDPHPRSKRFIPPSVPGFTVIKPEDGPIGDGSWKGCFYYKQDKTGAIYVLKFHNPDDVKKEIQERTGITSDEITRLEFLRGNTRALENHVTMYAEELDDQTLYTKEEPLPRRGTLRDILNRKEHENGLPVGKVLFNIAKGLALSQRAIHTKAQVIDYVQDPEDKFYREVKRIGAAHLDYKPENTGIAGPIILDEEGRVKALEEVKSLEDICVEDIRVFDYGLMSIGSSGKRNRGHAIYTAPELFGTDSPTLNTEDEIKAERRLKFKADVYSYGQMLFELFTGKTIFEEEFEDTEQYKTFITGMYKDPVVWNTAVARKVDAEKKIPKVFRELIKRCTSHHDYSQLRPILEKISSKVPEKIRDISGELLRNYRQKILDHITEQCYISLPRIADGEELVFALEDTLIRYERSKPKAKALRYSLRIATPVVLAIAAIGSYQAITTSQIADALQDELSVTTTELGKTAKKEDYGRKLRIIKYHEAQPDIAARPYAVQSYQDGIDSGELAGWLSRFEDKMTAYAAFLNPEVTFKAIEMTGSEEYKRLERVIGTLDTPLDCTLIDITNSCNDVVARQMWSTRYNSVEDIEKQAREKYGWEQAHLLELITPIIHEYDDFIQDMRKGHGLFLNNIDLRREMTNEESYKMLDIWQKISYLTGEPSLEVGDKLDNRGYDHFLEE